MQCTLTHMHVLNAGELLYCQDSSHKVAGIGDPKMKVHSCSFINLRNFNISKFHNLTDTNGQAFFFSAAPASATIAQVAAAAIGAVAAAAVVCSLRTLFHRDLSPLNSKRKKMFFASQKFHIRLFVLRPRMSPHNDDTRLLRWCILDDDDSPPPHNILRNRQHSPKPEQRGGFATGQQFTLSFPQTLSCLTSAHL